MAGGLARVSWLAGRLRRHVGGLGRSCPHPALRADLARRERSKLRRCSVIRLSGDAVLFFVIARGIAGCGSAGSGRLALAACEGGKPETAGGTAGAGYQADPDPADEPPYIAVGVLVETGPRLPALPGPDAERLDRA